MIKSRYISVSLDLFRSLTFKLQHGILGPFGHKTTGASQRQVKIGSSLGFKAYLGSSGFSLDVMTSPLESNGNK